MPYAQNAGARIWWEEQGSGEPLLLVMGHVFGSRMWHRVVPALAERYRILMFDNRGVGRTTTPRVPFTIGTMAADGLAVLDAAGVASAHVYGVSMGGIIAQEIALSAPQRVRSLILGCTGCVDAEPPPPIRFRRLRYMVPTRVAAALVARGMYGESVDAEQVAEDVAIIRATPRSSWGLAQQSRAIAAHVSLDRVADITAPTLVLHGTADRVVPFHRGEQLAERIPGARLVALPGSGHNYTTDATEASNRAVLDFLAQGVQGALTDLA